MRPKVRTIVLVLAVILIVWLIKFYFKFPSADIDIINIILTLSSILFGFLAGFFISELWTRYTEIRSLQGMFSSDSLNMIKCAEHFYNNKNFKKEFRGSVEAAAVANEIVEWDEGQLCLPYVRAVGDTFKLITIKNQKDAVYFEKLIDGYDGFVESTVRLDMLGKERLFSSEWVIISLLSLVMAFSVLFLDASNFFSKVIVLTFPVIITLALSIIYDLDTLMWSKETISLEPNAKLFDAIGVRRVYLKQKESFISHSTKDYRTEEDLVGDLKQIYLDIIKQREP